MSTKRALKMLAGFATITILFIATGLLRAEEAKEERSQAGIEVNFRKVSDFDCFKNLAPEIIDFKQEGLSAARISALKDGINLDGLLLFDPGKHQDEKVALYGNGTYSMDFVVNPTGAYQFGIMLGSGFTDKRSFVYFKQNAAIFCYASYNGGAYKLVLSVDGSTKESKGIEKWEWKTKWYRMNLKVESLTDVSVNMVNISSKEILDSITFRSTEPFRFLPSKLWVITETSMKMDDFLRIGRFSALPD